MCAEIDPRILRPTGGYDRAAHSFPANHFRCRSVSSRAGRGPPWGDLKDAFLSPHFGWLIEVLREHIRPDQAQGGAPEIPRYEENRVEGSTADVDTWTSKDVRELTRSHVNFVIADTQRWEQAATFILDTHPRVEAFVKNAVLGFGIPYLNNGQMHDYVPDFLVRLKDLPNTTVIFGNQGL